MGFGQVVEVRGARFAVTATNINAQTDNYRHSFAA
jgi:hypothetical protein